MLLSATDTLELAGHRITATYSGGPLLGGSRSNPIGVIAMWNAVGQPSTRFASDEMVSIYCAHFPSRWTVSPSSF